MNKLFLPSAAVLLLIIFGFSTIIYLFYGEYSRACHTAIMFLITYFTLNNLTNENEPK